MKSEITAQQRDEIEKVRGKNVDPRVEKRLKVLVLRAEGKTLQEIAEETGFHVSNVSKILKLYHTEGLSALAQTQYGKRRNMTLEEESAFLHPFKQREAAGQIVTPREIRAAYEEKVGHTIGGSQIYYLLKRHGWRATWVENACQQDKQ